MEPPVAPRPLLIVLVFALPILVVAFSVVMGAYAIALAAGDSAAAAALWWVAMSCAILGAADLILLAICLGIDALALRSPASWRSDEDDRQQQ